MTENKELTKALATAEVASSIPNQASVSQFAVVEAELEAAIRRDAVAAAGA